GLLAQGGEAGQSRQAQTLMRAIETDRDTARAQTEWVARLFEIRSAKADDPDGSMTDSKYAEAFREAGIEPDLSTPEESGSRIGTHKAGVARALLSALDDWASLRRKARKNASGATRLAEAARVADPEPWRDRLRLALDRPAGQLRLAA